MGFRVQDITPYPVPGPTVLIPTSKDVVTKVFAVSRSDTSTTLKAVLPADASIIEFSKFGSSNSDAGSTATVTISFADNTGTLQTATALVKGAGTTTGHVQMPGLPNIQPTPLTGDLKINAVYAETGTASTTGGPWYIKVLYVR